MEFAPVSPIMDQIGKKTGDKVEEVCGACGKERKFWTRGGVVINGTTYCCRGCGMGTGCTCSSFRNVPAS